MEIISRENGILSGDKTDFIDWYINSIKVKGILIGSSNQSHNTYFSYDASKGEADLLMFTDEIFAKHMTTLINLSSNYPNDNFDGCVLSKSIAGCTDDGEDYLNSIKILEKRTEKRRDYNG